MQYFFMYLPKSRYIFRRILARLVDGLLVVLVVSLAAPNFPPEYQAFVFLLYNLLFIFHGGQTIGRRICRLHFQSVKPEFIPQPLPASFIYLIKRPGWLARLAWREMLFLLLWPVWLIELIFADKPFVHERFSLVFLKLKAYPAAYKLSLED